MRSLHRPHPSRQVPHVRTPAPTEPANRLLGTRVDPLTMDQTVRTIEELIEDHSGHHNHLAMNAAKLVAASHD